ncbi:MAG: hypothetical protein UT94_C0028G0004 [Candidatus Uhrbacteria bacterium GW2011_GWF2_40_263]|nr:MAG: hypothetical protein UT94_C0028G0004 [Candidatus Uhrbacteria bacterium GW2011_GWF2_40_263]
MILSLFILLHYFTYRETSERHEREQKYAERPSGNDSPFGR